MPIPGRDDVLFLNSPTGNQGLDCRGGHFSIAVVENRGLIRQEVWTT